MDKYGSSTYFKRQGSVPPKKKSNKIYIENLERTANPEKLYLKDMGSISLLTREEEIALARQIEVSKKNIIKALSRTQFLFSQIFDLRTLVDKTGYHASRRRPSKNDQNPSSYDRYYKQVK